MLAAVIYAILSLHEESSTAGWLGIFSLFCLFVVAAAAAVVLVLSIYNTAVNILRDLQSLR